MDITNKFQIVIARYNEDINWLLPYKDITIIYNKGNYIPSLNKFQTIYLENVGRESHTYMYHIVNNYDNLADKTLFFQGNISDHKMLDIEDYFKKDDFIGKFNELNINDLLKNINHYGKYKKDYINGNMKKCNLTPYDWINKVIGINMDNITKQSLNVVWGANFSLSKKLILSKPKEFYQNILRYIDYHQNLEEGHYLERTWYIIFNYPYISKSKIYYLFFNNYEKINDILKILKEKYNDEIHLWMPILANYEYGNEHKISFIKSNNKYILINPLINISDDNESYFYIDIKCKNNIYILIEFENDNIEEYSIKYEIILDNKNNRYFQDFSKEINRYDKGKIQLVHSTESSEDIERYYFNISNKIIIKKNLETIFNIENISKNINIKNIKIKSLYNDIYLDYKMNNQNEYSNIKIYLCNNTYDNIKLFYTNNYYDHFIEKIDLLSMFVD